jgi:hypothetical protein
MNIHHPLSSVFSRSAVLLVQAAVLVLISPLGAESQEIGGSYGGAGALRLQPLGQNYSGAIPNETTLKPRVRLDSESELQLEKNWLGKDKYIPDGGHLRRRSGTHDTTSDPYPSTPEILPSVPVNPNTADPCLVKKCELPPAQTPDTNSWNTESVETFWDPKKTDRVPAYRGGNTGLLPAAERSSEPKPDL